MEYRSGAIPRGLLQLRVERLRDRIARAKQCPLLARKPTLVQRWHLAVIGNVMNPQSDPPFIWWPGER